MYDLTRSNVLVTGGAGFIGCAISQRLAPLCTQYLVIDNLHPQVHPDQARPARLDSAAELRIADVTEPSLWDDCLMSIHPEIVIHLAAETGTGQSLSEATRHANVNVVGTTRMLDGFTNAGVKPKMFVLCSSRAVYGEGRWERSDGSSFYPGQRSHRQLEAGQWDFPQAVPMPSDCLSTNPQPTSIYGATKLAQEHLLTAWCGARDVPLRVLRLQNVYGPGQSLTNSYTGIVSLFSQLARAGGPIPVYEDGRITRDFVYVDDVARAIEASLSVSVHGSVCVDIGSGRGTSIWELATEIARLRDSPQPQITGNYRDGDVRHATCNVEAAAKLLDWHPEWSLSSGLNALQDWIDSELSSGPRGSLT